MREVSFVNKLKFNFAGSVTKRALVIGDADNDQRNELVCANLQGDLAIFKDRNSNKYAYASDLGMVTACIVGDVINAHRNCIAAINTEGWLFIFDLIRPGYSVSRNVSPDQAQEAMDTRHPTADDDAGGAGQNQTRPKNPIKLNLTYDQRMPANCKDLLLADLDGDGQNELIVGLTDRVLRTYKWITIGPDRGKFVGLYKWEFADQIGAVSLNPSQHENCQDIIVAQPGGTYAKLECFDKKPTSISLNSPALPPQPPSISSDKPKQQQQQDIDNIGNQQQQHDHVLNDHDDNVRTEYISKLTPEYHQLALAQMRNHHISTEVLGGIRDKKDPDTHSLIVIATLDGTLMLVNKDEILWSIQVDHQLFALAMIETTKTLEMADGYISSSNNNNSNSDCRPKLSQSESTCTIVPSSKFDNHQQQQQQQQQLTATNGSNSNQTDHGDSVSITIAAASSSSASANYCDHDDSNKSNKRKMTSQYFAVCAWNGKTYIIDEERNYLRFKFDEAVSAFTAGNYYFDGLHHSTLVYATFNNQLVLYYDVLLNQIRPMYLLNEIINNPQHNDLLKKLEILNKKVLGDSVSRDSDARQLQDLLHGVLYAVADEEFDS